MKRMEDETRETRTSEAITHLQRTLTHTTRQTPPKGAAGTVCHPPLSISVTVFRFSPPPPRSSLPSPPSGLPSFASLLVHFSVSLRRLVSFLSNHTRQETVKPVYTIYISSGAAMDEILQVDKLLDVVNWSKRRSWTLPWKVIMVPSIVLKCNSG